MRCSCGGSLEPTVLLQFDLSDFAGIPAVAKNIKGLCCLKCHCSTLEGLILDFALDELARKIISFDRPLTARELIYIRKHLRLTRSELVAKLPDATLALLEQWEEGVEAIPYHIDTFLRGLMLFKLAQNRRSLAHPPQIEYRASS
ncbi:hypothetical protein HY628_01950 [Candidatus Uhrbacteria bacterium]|nr:hypothetical protein [Candidatus Uhrbacteria bacterium]